MSPGREHRAPRRGIAILIASGIALSLTAGIVAAHNTTYPTQLDLQGASAPPTDSVVSGKIDARPKCLPNRTVELFRRDPALTLLDTDKTSQNGAWAARGNIAGAGSLFVRVKQKDIGGGAHNHVCQGQAEVSEP